MDVLELTDPESRLWLDIQLPKLHLLVGDSIARDSSLQSRIVDDHFRNEAVGGATWGSLARQLPSILQRWASDARAQGRRLGSAVIWLTGNDVYNRRSLLPSFTWDSLESIAEVAFNVTSRLLREAEHVLVLVPLPRLSVELFDLKWEQSEAFHFERRLRHQLPRRVLFIPLGRQLTRKMSGRHTFTRQCTVWYKPDRTHLSPAGYSKLGDSQDWPIWLKMKSGE